jgi:hypothetical protein
VLPCAPMFYCVLRAKRWKSMNNDINTTSIIMGTELETIEGIRPAKILVKDNEIKLDIKKENKCENSINKLCTQ